MNLYIRDKKGKEEKIFSEDDELTIGSIEFNSEVTSIEIVLKDEEQRNKMIIRLLQNLPYASVSDVNNINDDEVLEYYTFKLNIAMKDGRSVYIERE